jgi:hypothetical protein
VAIRDHLFDRVHRTGEHAKNDLPNILKTAIREEAWRKFTKADGTSFNDLVEWLFLPLRRLVRADSEVR